MAVGSRAFPYDANGNMTVIDGMTNTWDFKDRLVRVENAEMRADYAYDYSDRRVMKSVFWKVPSTNNVSKANPGHVLYPDKYFEVREGDAPVKYVWNGSIRVARVTGSLATTARVQRFRLFPGQNLLSLSITATNTAGVFDPGGAIPGAVTGIRRWVAAGNGWADLVAGEVLPAGMVLWVEASTNTVWAVTGTYTRPTSKTLSTGTQFVGGWGLDPLEVTQALPAAMSFWHWEPNVQAWAQRLANLPTPGLPTPALIPASAGLFVRPEASSTLAVPEAALAVRYYHQDHLGSSSVLTDADGALVSETANYAFGIARNEFLPRNLREAYQFTQKENDMETSLAYFRARYLSSGLARFTRADQVSDPSLANLLELPQDHNPYAYCANRPLNHVDPSGCTRQQLQPLFDPKVDAVDTGVDWDAAFKAVNNSIEKLGATLVEKDPTQISPFALAAVQGLFVPENGTDAAIQVITTLIPVGKVLKPIATGIEKLAAKTSVKAAQSAEKGLQKALRELRKTVNPATGLQRLDKQTHKEVKQAIKSQLKKETNAAQKAGQKLADSLSDQAAEKGIKAAAGGGEKNDEKSEAARAN